MSKFPRRRFSSASCRGAAFASLLVASLVGFVGCSGGANPFCCDSKEKEQLDQNLERAQSVDEDADASDSSNDDAKKTDGETQEEKKDTTFAGLGGTDGSGDAPAIAASTAPAQQVPVTASTGAVAQNALQDAVSSAVSASSAAETPVDANALLPAPELAPASPTPPSTDAPAANATENENVDENAAASQAPTDGETPAPEAAPDEPSASPEQDARPAQDPTPAETPKTAARAARRVGPQRAASSRVAQRSTPRTLAVPETRGAATVAPSVANVVKVRAQTAVPAVESQAAAPSRPEILPSLGAQTPSNVIKIKKRAIIP